MEIEHIRKELNHLLENVVEHSKDFSNGRPIPSLEIGFVLSKIHKMQESLSVLRHLLEEEERGIKKRKDEQRKAENATKPAPLVEETVVEVADEATLEVDVVEEPVAEVVKTEEVKGSGIIEKGPVKNIEQLPIAKLSDALTLNDRYLYANELFAKDMNTFNELVKNIDACSNLNEAKNLFSSFDWDDENEHVLSFALLVERRFMK